MAIYEYKGFEIDLDQIRSHLNDFALGPYFLRIDENLSQEEISEIEFALSHYGLSSIIRQYPSGTFLILKRK